MYSEQQIDKLIQPVIDRQIEVNNSVIKIIAERIKEIGELLPSDIFKLEMIAKTGADIKRINKEIAKIARMQVNQNYILLPTIFYSGYFFTIYYLTQLCCGSILLMNK